jgi:hypothetical protein
MLKKKSWGRIEPTSESGWTAVTARSKKCKDSEI